MVDARQKIRAGLDKHEASKLGLKTPRFAKFAGRRVGLNDLKISRNDIAKLHSRLTAIREATTAALTEQTAAIQARYDKEGWVSGEKDGHRIDVLTAPKRKTLTDRAIASMEKEVVALVADEVSEILLKLNEAKADLMDARAAWVNNISVLMRSTLSSKDRETYTANMANAGPTELLDYAKEAIREHNHAMGAAVLSRIDRLPSEMKKSLEFTKHEVAEGLTYETFNAAIEHIALSEYAVLRAAHDGREALGQKLNETDKIKVGHERIKVQEEIGREVVPADLSFKAVLSSGVVGTTENLNSQQAEQHPKNAAPPSYPDNVAKLLRLYEEKKWDEYRAFGLECGILEEVGPDKGDGNNDAE